MVKYSLFIFLVWFYCEGIFRKWLINDYQQIIFFVKYVIWLFPIVIISSRRLNLKRQIYPFSPLIVFYFFWCIIEFANNKLTNSLIVKSLGAISHLYFITLIVVIPYFFNTRQKIIKFFEVVAFISLPIFILGIMQYLSPYDAFINKYADESQQFALVSGSPRVSGVFSYIAPYSNYLSFILLAIIFLIITTKTLRYKIFYCFLFVMGLTNLFMTGYRKALFLIVIESVILVTYFIFQSKIKIKKLFLILAFLCISLLSFVNFSYIGSQSFTALQERIRTNNDIIPRIIDNYDFKYYINESGIFGYGLGTTYQGSRFFIDNYKDMPYVESENSRLIIEFGPIGFIIVFILRISILYYSTKVYFRTKERLLKLLTMILIIYQFPAIIMFSDITYSYIANIIYWFNVGLVVCINNINISRTQIRKIANHTVY